MTAKLVITAIHGYCFDVQLLKIEQNAYLWTTIAAQPRRLSADSIPVRGIVEL
jgi:hypothetical protein